MTLLVPFVAGIIAAPYVKPAGRAIAKKVIGAAFQAKQLVAEAREDLEDVVAEATAEATASYGAAQRRADAVDQPSPSG